MTFIWATALVIGVLVFVHELGHFLAARSVGVRVEKFSVGFPPRFLSITSVNDGFDIKIFFYRLIDGHFKWAPVINSRIGIPGRVGSSTEYTIALIPLGGYVKMAGVIDESLDTVITNSPDEFMSKSVIQKIWILSAGVLMNVLIAFILFSGISYVQGKPEVIDKGAIIGEVVSGNSADKAGLKSGDEIISINNQSINKWIDLQTVLRPIPNTPIDVNIIRDGKELNFSFTTSSNFIPNENGIDTIGVIGIVPVTIYQPITLTESLNYGLNGTLNSFGMIMLTFKMLGNGSASISDLGGPIMIGKIAGEAAETGWMPLFTLMALISVNLAFLNILPIPGLDGGQIFIILIEAIIRKPLSLKARLAVQQLGMVFLLMIMVTVMFNDISRLFN
tara:strand:- start:299 stop:1471 length:1173 start_codon:yes stop_codon:yes gene_type:complete